MLSSIPESAGSRYRADVERVKAQRYAVRVHPDAVMKRLRDAASAASNSLRESKNATDTGFTGFHPKEIMDAKSARDHYENNAHLLSAEQAAMAAHHVDVIENAYGDLDYGYDRRGRAIRDMR
jgi:hypothetical protein